MMVLNTIKDIKRVKIGYGALHITISKRNMNITRTKIINVGASSMLLLSSTIRDILEHWLHVEPFQASI